MVLFGGREDSAHLGVLTSVKAAYGDKLVLIGELDSLEHMNNNLI